MKYICDKCGYCRESDNEPKDIWVRTKIGDRYEVQHYCYECGKPIFNLIDTMQPKIERTGDEDEY